MLHKLKIISYWLIILFVLILPSQAVAQCSQDECAGKATYQGLILGGAGYDFAGPFGTKGCYSYESGKYQGRAYFGTGGSPAQMEAAPAAPKYRISCGSKKSAAPGMPPTAVAPGMPPTTAAQAKDPECARFTGKAYRKRCGGGRTKGCIPPFRCFAKGHTPPTNLPARLHR